MGMFQEFSRNRAKQMQERTSSGDDDNDESGGHIRGSSNRWDSLQREDNEQEEDDEDDSLMNGSLFRRADDYGGGFRDQRTKQSEMDSLMQMSLEYAGNNEDEEDQKNKEADDDQIDTSDLFKSLEYRQEKVQKDSTVDVYSARIRATNNSSAANNRRYQGNRGYGDSQTNNDVDSFQANGYSRDARRNEEDDDEDDDELDRGGDPLSLEELDGWMNQINNSAAAAQAVMPAAATLPLDDAPSPGQQAEVDFLRKELGDLGVAHPDLAGFQAGGDKPPEAFDLYPAQQQ